MSGPATLNDIERLLLEIRELLKALVIAETVRANTEGRHETAKALERQLMAVRYRGD